MALRFPRPAWTLRGHSKALEIQLQFGADRIVMRADEGTVSVRQQNPRIRLARLGSASCAICSLFTILP